MSKYFGKCFGPSTPVTESSFWLRCPSFSLSKFTSQLKSIQSVVLVGILGICVTSWILRILGLRVTISKSQRPISRVLGVRVSCPRVPVSGARVSGSRVPGSHGPSFQGAGSQSLRVLGRKVAGLRFPSLMVPGLRLLRSQVSGLRVPRPSLRSWF